MKLLPARKAMAKIVDMIDAIAVPEEQQQNEDEESPEQQQQNEDEENPEEDSEPDSEKEQGFEQVDANSDEDLDHESDEEIESESDLEGEDDENS